MALKLGQPDPFAMLDAMGGLFDYWLAFDRVEPFGDEWRQSATVAAEVRLLRAKLGGLFGHDMPDFSLATFMPLPQPEGEAEQRPETQEERAEREQRVLKLGLGIKG